MLGLLADRTSRLLTPGGVARFYAGMPGAVADHIARARFRRTVRWAARRSPFYRRAFAEHGIDPARVRTPADLGGFFTTPDDLAQRPEDFLCEKPAIVFESSGTSGKN